jgi:hypothetical protein
VRGRVSEDVGGWVTSLSSISPSPSDAIASKLYIPGKYVSAIMLKLLHYSIAVKSGRQPETRRDVR